MRKELCLSGQLAAIQIYPVTEKLQQDTWYFCKQLLSVTKDRSDLLMNGVSIPDPHPKAPGFLVLVTGTETLPASDNPQPIV